MFRSARIYLEVARLLVTYTFRLPARRFVLFELFDKVAFTADQLTQWYEQPLLGGASGGASVNGGASGSGGRGSVGTVSGGKRHGSQYWQPQPQPPPMQ